jgi:hypothetical protein
MNKELLCKDCEHAILPSWPMRLLHGVRFAECRKSYVEPKFNPVDGTSSAGFYESALVVRIDTKICGPDATSWMPRTKYDLFKLIKHSEQ